MRMNANTDRNAMSLIDFGKVIRNHDVPHLWYRRFYISFYNILPLLRTYNLVHGGNKQYSPFRAPQSPSIHSLLLHSPGESVARWYVIGAFYLCLTYVNYCHLAGDSNCSVHYILLVIVKRIHRVQGQGFGVGSFKSPPQISFMYYNIYFRRVFFR